MKKSIVVSIMAVLVAQVALASPEDDLEALDRTFVEAMNKMDIDTLMGLYADDAISMDAGPGLWNVGAKAIRRSWTAMVATMEGIKLELHDAHYKVVGDVGYAYGLYDLAFTDKASRERVTSHGRFLSVSETRNGKWVYVVDHASAPFIPPDAMESGSGAEEAEEKGGW